MIFYILAAVGFAVLARRPSSDGDLLVRTVLQYLLFFWLVLPFFLLRNLSILQENVPFEESRISSGYLLELCAFLFSAFIYLILHGFLGKIIINKDDRLQLNHSNLTHLFILVPCIFLIFLASFYSIFTGVTYESANLMGGTAGVGGSFGLPLLEPLLVSFVVAFLVSSKGYGFKWLAFAFFVILLYSIAKFLEGSRFSALLSVVVPIFILLFRRGRFYVFSRLLFFSLILSPFLIYGVNAVAEYRVGGSYSFSQIFSLDALELLLVHLYIKFSSVISSISLSELVDKPLFSEGLKTISGVPLSFIPRFFWPDKPISGSIDGLESGLPYRIAAEALGYPEWGNVGLSPFISADWFLGSFGVLLTLLVFSFNLIAVATLVNMAARGRFLFAGLAFYILGLPHFTGIWVDFSAGLSVLFRTVIFGLLIVALYKFSPRQG